MTNTDSLYEYMKPNTEIIVFSARAESLAVADELYQRHIGRWLELNELLSVRVTYSGLRNDI